METTELQTPIGAVVAVVTAHGVCAVDWPHRIPAALTRASKHGPLGAEQADALDSLRAWLDAYFGRRFGELPDLALDLRGTVFQRTVWTALLGIGVGETRTYGAIAAELGRPSAARAVGAAIGSNPFAIVVPCHRAVGAAGLTGYAGGLDRKRWLLAHERG